MQYSPKLKTAIEEIKQILIKHDIAASVVLHTPGFSEYLLHITPTYSCAWLENGGIRVKAKKADYNGDVAMRNKRLADTVNMIRLLSETAGQNALALLEVSDHLDKVVGADHRGPGHSSHTTQNN